MSVSPRLLEEARRQRAKRRFSQNFLVDEGVLQRIADCLHLSPGDRVVEIGPGLGFLTERLLERSERVTAVELERDMAAYLRRRFGNDPRLTLVEQDILRFDFSAIQEPQFKVVGNLPYQITSRILFHLAGELAEPDYALRRRLTQLTIMVQKEVADRITSPPGYKAYNRLSIALQVWFDTRREFTVPAGAFFPQPKVTSAVVSLFPRQEPLVDRAILPEFDRLVQAAFSAKRKTLRNALLGRSFASGAVLDRIFQETGISPDIRAEHLSIEAFGALSHAFRTYAGQD